ncbi:hypothetical protein Z043_125267, partial [Scleropages formosus]
ATEAERLLSAQVQSLREDFEKKSISTDEHMTRLENLQAEIRILSERKRELERRMSAVLAENDVLQAAVDAIQERRAVFYAAAGMEWDLCECPGDPAERNSALRSDAVRPETIWSSPQLHQIRLDVRDMATSHEPLGSRLEELSAEENLLDETEREEVTQQLWEVQCQVHLLCCELRGTDTTDPALPPEMPSTQDVSVERLRGNLMELRGLVQNLLDHSETMHALLPPPLRASTVVNCVGGEKLRCRSPEDRDSPSFEFEGRRESSPSFTFALPLWASGGCLLDSLRCGGTAPETQLQRLKEELQEAKELLSRERERARSSQQEVALLSMELRSARREERESPRAAAGLQEEPAERLLSAVRERERDDAVAK